MHKQYEQKIALELIKRMNNGEDYRKLAKETGISQVTLWRWKKGISFPTSGISKNYHEYYMINKKKFKEKYGTIEYRKKYYEKNKILLTKYRLKLREKVINKLGGKCANPYNFPHPDWCNDRACLQIDHVNGGGKKEHNKYKSGTSFLMKVLSDNEHTYQLLCANCNWIKRYREKK